MSDPTLRWEAAMGSSIDAFMNQVIANNPGETEFHQAVREVAESVVPVVQATPAYRKMKIPRADRRTGKGL
jgi:hypothetical protein